MRARPAPLPEPLRAKWAPHEHAVLARLAAARPHAVEATLDPAGDCAPDVPPDEAALLAPAVAAYEDALCAELPPLAGRPAADVLAAVAAAAGLPLLEHERVLLAGAPGGALPVVEVHALVGRLEWGTRHVLHVYLPVDGEAFRPRAQCRAAAAYATVCGCSAPTMRR